MISFVGSGRCHPPEGSKTERHLDLTGILLSPYDVMEPWRPPVKPRVMAVTLGSHTDVSCPPRLWNRVPPRVELDGGAWWL
jgi:hypothetical protein